MDTKLSREVDVEGAVGAVDMMVGRSKRSRCAAVGVWSRVLVGRIGAVPYTHLQIHTHSFHFVITPSHHSLLKIQSRILCILPERTNNLVSHPPTKGWRISSCRTAKQPHIQRASRDHQSKDRCGVRESLTRLRSSPLRLDPQVSRPPLHLAQFASTLPLKQLGNPSHHIPSDPSTAIYSSCSQAPRASISRRPCLRPNTAHNTPASRQPNKC